MKNKTGKGNSISKQLNLLILSVIIVTIIINIIIIAYVCSSYLYNEAIMYVTDNLASQLNLLILFMSPYF